MAGILRVDGSLGEIGTLFAIFTSVIATDVVVRLGSRCTWFLAAGESVGFCGCRSAGETREIYGCPLPGWRGEWVP